MIVSTTIASLIELFGRESEPETARLVEVTFVITPFVPAKLAKKPLVDVTLVPVAVEKPKAPDNVPPLKSK